MNILRRIINKKWGIKVFFAFAFCVSVYQHYRVFNLDIIGYHSWRQTQTQTVIENFAFEDFNILNPRVNDLHYHDRILRMEFPIAQWLVASFLKLFGNHLIVSRLFFLFVTFFSCIGIFKLVKELTKDELISSLTAWLFLFSPVIYFYSVNPMPDNLALCFGIWSIFFWIKFIGNRQFNFFIFSCVLFALSLAVKLPFIVFGSMYLALFFEKTGGKKRDFKFILIPFFISILPLIWYALVIGNWKDNGIVEGITQNNLSINTLCDILFFNVVSTLPELLINYATFPLFIIGVFYTLKQLKSNSSIHCSLIFMGCACTAYFLYELNMINKVHDYYLFPFLPFIFLIVAKAIWVILQKNSKLKYLIVLSLVIAPLTAYLRCNSRWNSFKPGFSKEYLMNKRKLKNLLPPTAKIIVHGDESKSIVLYHLDRYGWSYAENRLDAKDFDDNIKNGAEFLVTDCNMDTTKFLGIHHANLIFQDKILKLYTIR